jgi:hypothetical protein
VSAVMGCQSNRMAAAVGLAAARFLGGRGYPVIADMIPVPIPIGSSRSWRTTKRPCRWGKCNLTAGNSLVDCLVFPSPIDS